MKSLNLIITLYNRLLDYNETLQIKKKGEKIKDVGGWYLEKWLFQLAFWQKSWSHISKTYFYTVFSQSILKVAAYFSPTTLHFNICLHVMIHQKILNHVQLQFVRRSNSEFIFLCSSNILKTIMCFFEILMAIMRLQWKTLK